MEIVSLVTFMFLLMTSCLHGAPFKHASHQGDTNTNSNITSTSDCHKNCSFVITESSLSDAHKLFAKFLNMQKSMLVYVNIDPHSNLTLSPANDQKKQNQMREWQWLMSSNSWYINLPIDLDYASFHVTYVGDSRIRLKIEAIESDNCCISDTGIEQVRDLLWSDLFSNRSGSLLCNRYFDHQEWKSTFYALTTVWIGYDLLCIAPTIDKSYEEKSHAAASVLIPLFCFFIALYHPLANKIIANPHTKNHLKEVELSKEGMKLFDYLKGDKPFGYKRVVLKFFFSNEKFAKDKRLIPAIKLCILYYFIYLFFNILPMMLDHYYDTEELEDFNSIYKFGLPVFHWKKNRLKYDYQLLLTCLLLLPLTSLANLWNYYEFVKSPDFVIFLKFPIVTDENTTAKNGKLCSYSWSLSENVDCMTAKLKKGRNRISKNNQHLPNTDEFYSKFIKRFTLLFSFEFWKHIFNLSTKVTFSLEPKQNKASECSDGRKPEPDKVISTKNNESSNAKPNEVVTTENSKSSNLKPNENSESINSKPNEVIPFKNSESSVGCNLPNEFKPIENIKTCNQKPNENISIGNRKSSNPKPNEVTITGKSESSILKPIEVISIGYSESSNQKSIEVNTIEKSETSNSKPNEVTKLENSESSISKPIEVNTIEKSESSNAKPNAKPNEVITIEKSESRNRKPNEDKEQKSGTDILSCICSTIVCLIGVIFILPINFILIVFTCAFPVFWFILYPLLNRVKMILSILIRKCKKSESEESTMEQNSPKETIKNVCCQLICLPVDIVSMFFLYQQFSVIVLIIRSIIYIVFIAITNYEHLLRIVIVVTSCFAYLGVFITRFIDRYSAILKIMFDEYEKNNIETQEGSTKESKKGPIFISEKWFNYVIDQCYAIREHFFFVVFKIVITIMFFSLALAVLFQSNIFDSTSRLTNILEYVFVVVTPSVFFKFFEKDTQEIIDYHKKDIIDHTNDYNSEEQEEENEKCCECLYDFINFCKSDTKTSEDSQTCCCLKQCTLNCTRTKDGEEERLIKKAN